MEHGDEEMFLVPGPSPLFLHCCPWWLLDTPAVREVAGYAFESGNGNLSAFFSGGNIPIILRDSIRMYDAGYQRGIKERLERERKT
jgi:hypothetical protein